MEPSFLDLETFEMQVERVHQLCRFTPCGPGHVIGACSMGAPSSASEEIGLSRWTQEVSSNRGFIISVAAAIFAYRQADEAFKQSDEYKIQQAVSMLMKPFQPSQPKEKVIQSCRPLEKVRTWEQHATIVSGRYWRCSMP